VRKWLLGGGEVILCVGISHSKSVVTVQRAFGTKDAPADKTIILWYEQLQQLSISMHPC
jgi:hypothetical protein